MTDDEFDLLHGESAPLAYENPNFLNSPDGRILRIMSEYAEPLARFRREQIQDTVVFFGSARLDAFSPLAARTCASLASSPALRDNDGEDLAE